MFLEGSKGNIGKKRVKAPQNGIFQSWLKKKIADGCSCKKNISLFRSIVNSNILIEYFQGKKKFLHKWLEQLEVCQKCVVNFRPYERSIYRELKS